MKYLGLDLGSKTLGISISDETLLVANVYKTIFFRQDDYDVLYPEIKEIVEKENVVKIILGYPKNMNGSDGKRAEITKNFRDKLEKYLNVPVLLEDERLTSVIADNILIRADISRQKRKKKIDGLAANIILQSYLDKERK